MSSDVSWLYEVALKPGRLDDFTTVVAELVESTKAEPGALAYEWTISEDGTTAHMNERYADSKAALSHLVTFRERFGQRFVATVDRTRLVVYGIPSDELRQALEGSRPLFMGPFVGFAR